MVLSDIEQLSFVKKARENNKNYIINTHKCGSFELNAVLTLLKKNGYAFYKLFEDTIIAEPITVMQVLKSDLFKTIVFLIRNGYLDAAEFEYMELEIKLFGMPTIYQKALNECYKRIFKERI